MKIALLQFALILIFGISINAQTYNQQWNVAIYDESFSPDHLLPTWSTKIYETKGDTLINEESYIKTYVSTDSLKLSESFYAGFRIDSGKVYLSPMWEGGKEELLYDYTLVKGDTTTIYRLRDGYNTVLVDSLGKIILNDSEYKTIYVTYNCNNQYGDSTIAARNDIWIEGFGSFYNGIFNEECGCATGCYITSYLLCCYLNNEQVYFNTEMNTCFKETVTNGIEHEANNSMHCFPNPTSGELTIECNFEDKFDIKIVNLLGRKIYSKIGIEDHTFRIDLGNHPAGVYVINITIADSIIQKKIIKH